MEVSSVDFSLSFQGRLRLSQLSSIRSFCRDENPTDLSVHRWRDERLAVAKALFAIDLVLILLFLILIGPQMHRKMLNWKRNREIDETIYFSNDKCSMRDDSNSLTQISIDAWEITKRFD